ncbi:MAG: uroporphyrinogen-III synthase [Fimbriimonadaceae bacterium]|nr:uroporphyrinogen-III synthase [Chitinophagales bacterium]
MTQTLQPHLKPVKSILVSQPVPENPKNPYAELVEKYKVKIDFRHFIKIQGTQGKDFRKQRINISDYSAVMFTNRIAIDHFFRLCEELRVKMPEMTKYFCVTEAIAVYLQKYIQYRKRKVFYGDSGKDTELFEILNKHILNEKILFPCTPNHKDVYTEYLKSKNANFDEAIMYESITADLSDMNGKINYDMLVLFTPLGVNSLFKNFPNFAQGELRIGCMGLSTLKAMEENGLQVDLKAPTPETPSIFMAIDRYLAKANKKK